MNNFTTVEELSTTRDNSQWQQNVCCSDHLIT